MSVFHQRGHTHTHAQTYQIQRIPLTFGFLFSFFFSFPFQSELTLPDLASSLESHGINLSKPDYYADSVFAGGMLNVNAAVQPTQANLQASQAAKGESKQAKKK